MRTIRWAILFIVVAGLGGGLWAVNNTGTWNPTREDVVMSPWMLLRAEADEDANTLDLTSEGDSENIPDTAIDLMDIALDPQTLGGAGYNSGVVGMEIIFAGSNAANDDFTYRVLAARSHDGSLDGPIRVMATGVGTLGTQAMDTRPDTGEAVSEKYWADTLTTTYTWGVTTVYSTDTSGNNFVASLIIKFLKGYRYVWVEITEADGSTGNEAGDVSVYYAID